MPRKAADKPATKKTSTRKKKTDVEAEAVAESAPIVETAASEAPVSPAPKKRGRKPKKADAPADTAADVSVKKTRGRKKAEAPTEVTADAPAVEAAPVIAEPLSGQLAFDGDKVPAEVVVEAPAAPLAEAPEVPAKKARKPRKPKEKRPELVLTTTLQLGDKEFDISDIAAKAYKEYKRVHKRKVVIDYHIYVKPEEGAAYFTINGEGSEDFKVEL